MSGIARSLFASAVAISAIALAYGCGVGPGPSTEGTATLDVTRDYGVEPVADGTVENPTESETVLRLLDHQTDITTRYGGGFVQSIEGIAGGVDSGRNSDWFFYVNGIESSIGSADVKVRGGDRIWWDYRDWTDAMGVTAVVGSFPEPMLQASSDEASREPVTVRCSPAAAGGSACDDTVQQLSNAGVEATVAPLKSGDPDGFDVLVGPYSELADLPQMKLIEQGPSSSGVFAGFADAGAELDGLAADTSKALKLGSGSGIVAALRDGDERPTWIVSGTDEDGVEAAAELLDGGELHDHYAVLTDGATTTPVPIVDEGTGE
ncbi:hypothetical protein BH10ACT11_BH10ACT11_16850 [soil metagenome]